jgi:hypothetical protein
MLSDRDQAMLEFEQSWWQFPGGKEAEIHARFGLSPTRYYQQLNQLIEQEEALAAAPLLVRRLRRLRTRRRPA